MAIAYDSSATVAGGTSTNTRTIALNNAAGDIIVVGTICADGAPATVTGVTYNSVALAQITNFTQLFSSNYRLECWYLVAPATGANNAIITWSASQARVCGVAVSFSGVHQTVPFGTVAKATGSSTAITVDVSSAAGELVFDIAACIGPGGDMTVGASQTQRVQSASDDRIGLSTEAGAATVTMSWTIANVAWGIGGIALKPAGAAAATTPSSFIGGGFF
jgi:hypothetical protein